ncbi:39S ribosomal protein L9, mitochondrial [Protopterus annectens]|uniref:39S ribosomal protein L9, mitochondrial n=1 Tax=Protopterus annectens TaxID=7888 RepID=UPI001CFB27B2|nr:39S ribosomal protein L9, mitochondrial [Protopterus annectens]
MLGVNRLCSCIVRKYGNLTVSLEGVRSISTSPNLGTVIVERWWKVPLAPIGKTPRLHPRRHRVLKFIEDAKHKPQGEMELILAQTVSRLGIRGDTVFVRKSLGRNKLLPQGLAVYPSPENKKMFEEERKTVEYLQRSHLIIGIKEMLQWELTKEVVCRRFLRQCGIVVPSHALKMPEGPIITEYGDYWCEVTVNGIDTVRVPVSVIKIECGKEMRYKHWLAAQKDRLSHQKETEPAES